MTLTMTNKRKPDFIGIGMERAGTSWLFTQIAAHPEIWVPPLKELHFFDVIDPEARFLKHRYSYHLKSRLKQKAAPIFKQKRRPEFYKNSYWLYLLWDYYYFTGKFNTDWYQRLFDDVFTQGRLCGEITPAYSNITPATIQMILDINPAMKFLLMIRDPADRLWSGIVHYFRHVKRRDMSSVTEQEMLDYLEHSKASQRSDLLTILRTWEQAVAPEKLLIQKFDHIKTKPEDLLHQTYQFLGVDHSFLPDEEIYKRKINAYSTRDIEMPSSVREVITTQCRPVMAYLSRTRPGLTEGWKE